MFFVDPSLCFFPELKLFHLSAVGSASLRVKSRGCTEIEEKSGTQSDLESVTVIPRYIRVSV